MINKIMMMGILAAMLFIGLLTYVICYTEPEPEPEIYLSIGCSMEKINDEQYIFEATLIIDPKKDTMKNMEKCILLIKSVEIKE